MKRKPLSLYLLDVLMFVGLLAIFWIVVGYSMDLEAGKPRNEALDKAIIVGAMAFFLLLVSWYFRSGQWKYDWGKEDEKDQR